MNHDESLILSIALIVGGIVSLGTFIFLLHQAIPTHKNYRELYKYGITIDGYIVDRRTMGRKLLVNRDGTNSGLYYVTYRYQTDAQMVGPIYYKEQRVGETEYDCSPRGARVKIRCLLTDPRVAQLVEDDGYMKCPLTALISTIIGVLVISSLAFCIVEMAFNFIARLFASPSK